VSIDNRGDTWPGRPLVKEFALERKLGLAETVGLSLSVVGPTVAMAFNASLVARAAGRAAPLAFVIGTVALGVVALSFVSFSKRVAHAGSAYVYIGQTLVGDGDSPPAGRCR